MFWWFLFLYDAIVELRLIRGADGSERVGGGRQRQRAVVSTIMVA